MHAEMTRMTSNTLELVGVPIHHDRGLVEIPGAEAANWGCGASAQNSLVGALDAVCHLLHFNGVDYVAMMGVSAHAFRVQVPVEGLCPSAAHAMCGWKTGERALAAVPIEWSTVQAGLAGTSQADDAIHIVRDVVDRGLPVLALSEETDLILGHFHDHLVGRTYDNAEEGYSALAKWPWTFMVPERRHLPIPPCQQVREGLAAAIEAWRIDAPVDGYFTGARAYQQWRETLSESKLEAMDHEGRWKFQHANAFLIEGLVDARRTAAAFLTRVCNALGPVARPELLAAAEVYRKVADEVLGQPSFTQYAPYPWMSDHEHPWDETKHADQIARLVEAERLESEAIAHLERAIQ